MKLKKIIATILFFGLVIGGLTSGLLFGQMSPRANAAPLAQKGDDVDNVDDANDDEAGEVEEAVSPDQAGITADEAKAAAEAAYPGTTAREVELEKERGVVAYEVELDNGLEVLIDPANGDILGVDAD